MIAGVGVDMVDVGRIRANLERYGERFARRILAEDELPAFHASVRPPQFLAKRFAAKEAAAKAFGTGMRNGLSFRDIRVAHDPLGRPLLEFSGRARELAEERSIQASHVSLTDESQYAVAYVLLETR